MERLAIYFLGAVICGIVAACIAHSKRRNTVAWFLAGLFGGIVEVIIIALRSSKETLNSQKPQQLEHTHLEKDEQENVPRKIWEVRHFTRTEPIGKDLLGGLFFTFIGGIFIYCAVVEAMSALIIGIPSSIVGIACLCSVISPKKFEDKEEVCKCSKCGKKLEYGAELGEYCPRCGVRFQK